ncbi:hypothetical protein [Rhodalgimonas zhirmunskyi]|uniref:Uncharacterized protein n=1 Tax=Rhodalgimonas zhirmunskyi TaxID=2964767 RepID=A0AAJ1UBE3_9RHOB|nr:hypothetical protein [Rhodoalgimonas zhirmunskyi]MDQ2094708.1 hypothetical protein [Rhodoalgimonas zhirmunskyi]
MLKTGLRGAAVALALWGGMAQGQQVEAQTTLGAKGISARIAEIENAKGVNRFELGMLQTLGALETSLKTRAEYGLGDRIANMPLFRIRVPRATVAPRKPATAETLSEIVRTFATDIAAARVTLEAARAQGVEPFMLDLTDIWFDANANGQRDEGEDAVSLLAPMILDWREMREFRKTGAPEALPVRFDEADLAWLMAYTHVLSGSAEAYLAFDPTPVLADLGNRRKALRKAPRIPNFYDIYDIEEEIARLQQQEETLGAKVKDIQTQMRPLQEEVRGVNTEMRAAKKDGDKAKEDSLRAQRDLANEDLKVVRDAYNAASREQRLVREERRAAELKLPLNAGRRSNYSAEFGGTMDMIYVVVSALKQQPDADHIKAAFTHWRAAIAENRTFWSLLEKETDDDHEWIANARQSSALGIELPPEAGAVWQGVLEDAEAVLNGRLLVPHPLLPPGYGISLTSYENNPTPLDLLEMIHGIAMYEHAAQGPLISTQRWSQFDRLTGGRAGTFALFFN